MNLFGNNTKAFNLRKFLEVKIFEHFIVKFNF